jgi:hypothetical protein
MMAFGQSPAKNQSAQERASLKGRFVAESENGCQWLGSFLGGCQSFIVEVDDRQLIKISYQFREQREEIPRESLDYRVVRSFHVGRDSSCDESIKDMGTLKGTEPDGHKVVVTESALRMVKNAPTLQPSTAPLPCYVLKPNGLRRG